MRDQSASVLKVLGLEDEELELARNEAETTARSCTVGEIDGLGVEVSSPI